MAVDHPSEIDTCKEARHEMQAGDTRGELPVRYELTELPGAISAQSFPRA